MSERSELTKRLETTLKVVADSAEVETPPFVPYRQPMVVLPEEAEAGRHRLRALAAAVILAALAASVVAFRAVHRDPDDVQVKMRDNDREPGALVPGWVPAGIELWHVRNGESAIDPEGAAGGRYQLLGDPNQGRSVLLRVQPVRAGGPSGTAVQVRGQSGVRFHPTGQPEGIDAIAWTEGDASVEARYRGMTRSEALDVINALTWRSAQHREGFQPPGDGAPGGLKQVGEGITVSERQVQYAELAYGQAPSLSGDRNAGMVVRTVAPAQGTDGAYLSAWFTGIRGADGVVRNVYRSTYRSWLWPNGKQVWVTVVGPGVDDAVLDRIVGSVTLRKAADLREIAAQATQRVAAAPLIASGKFATATVEIRGGATIRVVCLQLDGVHCDTQPIATAMGPDTIEVGGFLVGGQWYVATARSDGAASAVVPAHDPGAPFPAATARSGPWEIALAEVPAGTDEVEVYWGWNVKLTRPEPPKPPETSKSKRSGGSEGSGR